MNDRDYQELRQRVTELEDAMNAERCGCIKHDGSLVHPCSAHVPPTCPRCVTLSADLDAARRESARLTELVEKAYWEGYTTKATSANVGWLAFQQREGLAPKEGKNGGSSHG
jgi:hypothetical protein